MKHSIVLLILLVAAWLLWSGHREPMLLAFGALSCIGVAALAARMRVPRYEDPYLFALRTVTYLPWLAWEIVKAAVDVTKLVIARDLALSPRVIRVPATQSTEIGQVVYANSITLTPGTISLDLRDGHILVHALTREAAEGLLTGDMDRRVTALEDRA